MGYGVCFLENKKGALLSTPIFLEIKKERSSRPNFCAIFALDFAILDFELGIQVWLFV